MDNLVNKTKTGIDRSKEGKEYLDAVPYYGTLGRTCVLVVIVPLFFAWAVLVLSVVFIWCSGVVDLPCAATKASDQEWLIQKWDESKPLGVARSLLTIFRVLSFVIVVALGLAASITFAVGAPLNKIICQWVRDPELTYLRQLLDGGPGMGSILRTPPNEYALSNKLLKNGSIPFTASGALKACRSNAPLYSALNLDNFMNLSHHFDYKRKVNFAQDIATMKLDFGTVTLLSNTTYALLTSLADAISSENISESLAELNKPTLKYNLSALENSLHALAESVRSFDRITAARLDLDADEARKISEGPLYQLQQRQETLREAYRLLREQYDGTSQAVTLWMSTLINTNMRLQVNGTLIMQHAATDFGRRLTSIADQYMSYAINATKNSIGKCRPLWDTYDNLLSGTVCRLAVDKLDKLWFGFGWCTCFFVVILAISHSLSHRLSRARLDQLTYIWRQRSAGACKRRKQVGDSEPSVFLREYSVREGKRSETVFCGERSTSAQRVDTREKGMRDTRHCSTEARRSLEARRSTSRRESARRKPSGIPDRRVATTSRRHSSVPIGRAAITDAGSHESLTAPRSTASAASIEMRAHQRNKARLA